MGERQVRQTRIWPRGLDQVTVNSTDNPTYSIPESAETWQLNIDVLDHALMSRTLANNVKDQIHKVTKHLNPFNSKIDTVATERNVKILYKQ